MSLKNALFGFITAIVCLYVVSWYFARGGISCFSPSTLQTYGQSEILIPLTEIPIYRSQRSQGYRYELVHYLIEEGFWTPVEGDSRLYVVRQWNSQWKDGDSSFSVHCSRRSQFWINWSEENPEFARRLWPLVLRLLRDKSTQSTGYAAAVLDIAFLSKTIEEFEARIATDPDISPAIQRLK